MGILCMLHQSSSVRVSKACGVLAYVEMGGACFRPYSPIPIGREEVNIFQHTTLYCCLKGTDICDTCSQLISNAEKYIIHVHSEIGPSKVVELIFELTLLIFPKPNFIAVYLQT